MAPQYGLGVNFVIAGVAPRWAVGRYPSKISRNPGIRRRLSSARSRMLWGSVQRALPAARQLRSGATRQLLEHLERAQRRRQLARSPGGQRDRGWPQHVPLPGRCGLEVAEGHPPQRRTDTILVGQMASTGHASPGYKLGMEPLRFLRALFCVDSNYRELRGEAASPRKCPTTAAASRNFRNQHPVLFQATGWGHHPYHLTQPPDRPSPRVDADWVTFADLPKLERALDRVQRDYGSHRRFPLYLTEYGFNTNPPQPANAVSPSTQAAYLNQAEYMAWRDARVQTVSQYLLQDAPKNLDTFSAPSAPDWSTTTAPRSPRTVPTACRSGCVRQRAPRAIARSVGMRPSRQALPFRRPARCADSAEQRYGPDCCSHGLEGLLRRPDRLPESGDVRLSWTPPDNSGTIYSRSVGIKVG